MKAYVCIKQVPDTDTRIKIRPDGHGIDSAGIKWVMNPYDEFAVEEAIKMREAGKIATVTVFSLGPKIRVADTLRTALAMGADEAVLIDAPEDLDPITVGKALAAAIKAEGEFKVVLTGKLAIDDNLSAVGQALAEFLNIPHVTVVTKLEVSDSGFTADREVEGGAKEILQLRGPALIGASKGLNMPRYASLPGIMKAKKKTIKELNLAGLGVTAENKIKHTTFTLPPDKPPVKLLAGDAATQVKELARLLREEAKVI